MVSRGGWLVLIALASLTHLQARVWHDNLTLWTQAVEVTPQKPRAWINLGNAYEQQGDRASAVWAYERALHSAHDRSDLPPGVTLAATAIAATNLARLEFEAADAVDARRHLRRALRAAPQFAPALVLAEFVCAMPCALCDDPC